MDMKTVTSLRILILFAACVLAGSQVSCKSTSLASAQSKCAKQIIGNGKVLGSQALDIDQDSNLDEVVVYDKDGDIYALVALDSSSAHCKVVLDKYFTSTKLTTGRQTAIVRAIELVELTGDDKPEVHVWLDQSGGGPRVSFATHAIYTSANGSWQEAARFGLCLAFNSFKFREVPGRIAKDIYVDEDVHCEPPWSSQRTYTIMRWNGSRIMPIESGTFDSLTTDPP
jgi:hypothetical protein